LVDLPTEERKERLASLAESEPDIHEEVEALVTADRRADALLARYKAAADATAWDGLSAEPTPAKPRQPQIFNTVTSAPREGPSRLRSLAAHQIPPDLLHRAAGRLQMASAIIAIALTVYIVISSFASLGIAPARDQTTGTRIVFVAMLIVSIGVHFLGRSRWLRPERMLDVGLVYEVILAFGGGVAVQYFAAELRLPIWGVSEVAVVILVFAILVPNKPGRVLLAALVAATMDPVGDLVYGLRGGPTPSFSEMVGAYYANYLAAGVALVTAHVLTRLAREVGEARELGSYRLVELLGKGGMGQVWRAEHRLLARPAAIKLIRPDVLLDVGEDRETLVRRFEREAQTTALLRSPHTIELYDFGVTPEGAFYYVMELLDGLEMQQLVERFGPVPPGRAVHLLKQVCDSLVEAHASGLVHRDIKPANVYVCLYGMEADFVKVLDFGLVGRRSGMVGDARLTLERSPGGTPAFMAPEQIQGDHPIDGRTDIYAVGCLAFWLLTGRRVFEGATPLNALVKHIREKPDPPSSWSDIPIPTDLDELVLACLEKDPDRRPTSARALRSHLRGCSRDVWTSEEAERWWKLNQPRVARRTAHTRRWARTRND
jgi:serine/threonine-protein kinase